jgi:glycosyltransferase involved in cell wall biosynthesis
MLKILAVTDKAHTAIDRLATGVIEYMNGYDYKVLPIHPKRPEKQDIMEFWRLADEADIIDYHYFKTAEMLRSHLPELKNKPSILRHFNPYSIDGDWSGYDYIVACNKSIEADLKRGYDNVLYHPITRNPKNYTFREEATTHDVVLMVANRIEAKKGILEVAQACQELGVSFHLVGNISDPAYFAQVSACRTTTFSQDISDAALEKAYSEATLHVCNSQDNFESGTMPILEAMFSGVPVLTRNVGHVPDLYNGENLILNPNEKEDVEALTKLIYSSLTDKEALRDVSQKAWQTVKSYTDQRRARLYKRLYRQMQSAETPVSVIVPTASDPRTLLSCLVAIENQTYKNIEIVVSDDGDDPAIPKLVDEFRRMTAKPVVYLNSFQDDYGLARARNLGIIEACGDIIVFDDQRQIMQPEAVSEFVANLAPKQWLYGNKGGKKDFVENFSCIYRSEIIQMGMFSERCTLYGSLSQEVRARSRAQGFTHTYIESAKSDAAKN